jgi:hypothetical protein
VERELEFAQSRILRNLEEGQNLLNRFKGRPQCTIQNLVRMRAYYSNQQATLKDPTSRLQHLLTEDQYLYVWNYSLGLLMNQSLLSHTGRGVIGSKHLSNLLDEVREARRLYMLGKLTEATDVVMTLVNMLKPIVDRNAKEIEQTVQVGLKVRGGGKKGHEKEYGTTEEKQALWATYQEHLNLLRTERPFAKNNDIVTEAARHFGVS